MSKRARKCNFGEETKKINVDTFHPSFSLKCAKMSVFDFSSQDKE